MIWLLEEVGFFFFLTFADHCGITTLHDALYVRMRALLTQTYTHIQRKRGARGRGRRRRGGEIGGGRL